VAESRESQFQALLADAQEDPDVLGVLLFGSRSREGFVDERSDYDIGVVVTDGEGALAAFDERWPYAHGAGVEIASTTFSGLRKHGEYGSPTEWARYGVDECGCGERRLQEIHPSGFSFLMKRCILGVSGHIDHA
jgi:predicted nucleotidyltransferase